MGSATAINIAASKHETGNTVVNAWTNGTSATIYSTTAVSSVPSANGLSGHPSVSAYGWTVTMLGRTDFKKLARTGFLPGGLSYRV